MASAVPAAKVEIRFDGTTWVDVSDWVLAPMGVSITRGRASEADDPMSAGTCSLALSNDDGRFSPDLPSSPYYPHVTTDEGVALRVWVWVSGAWWARFYGTVQSWSVGWLEGDEGGRFAICTVTAVDSLGSPPQAVLRSAADEVVRRRSPSYWWPLRDDSGDAQPSAGTMVLKASSDDGCGAGGQLPLDEGDAQYCLFKSGSGGRRLVSGTLTGGRFWSISLLVLSAPTGACSLLDINGGDHVVSWTAANGFRLDGSGGYVPSSWPVVIRLSVVDSPTHGYDRLLLAAPGTAATVDYPTGTGPRLRSLRVNPTLSGGATWPAGQLVLTTYGSPVGLLGSRLIDSTSAPKTAPDFVLSAAGAADDTWSSIADVPAGEIILPPLEGRTAADVLGAMLAGTGARLVDDLAGGLRWVEMLEDSTPVAIPSGIVGQGLTWQTDSSTWRSDVTVTWPDGTSYTATRPDGVRSSAQIEGVHATKAADRSFADWLVNTASAGARLPAAPFDLLPLSEATRLLLVGLDPGGRVSLSGLPSQMPASLTCVVEGVDETLTHQSWDLTLKLSPDLVSRVGMYGSSTYDSGAVFAP